MKEGISEEEVVSGDRPVHGLLAAESVRNMWISEEKNGERSRLATGHSRAMPTRLLATRAAVRRSCRLFSATARSSNALKSSYGLWIDGQEVPAASGATMAIDNPATGETLCQVAEGQEEDMKRAIDSASAAFEDGRWSNMEARDRARILNKAAELLRARIPDMAAKESLQTGRPLREYMMQLGRVPDWCHSTTVIHVLSTGHAGMSIWQRFHKPSRAICHLSRILITTATCAVCL